MADEEKVLYEAPLRDGEVLRAAISVYQGKEFVQLRVWYTDKASGEMKPGKGLGLLKSQFPLIIAAVKALHAEIHGAPAGGPR